MSTRRSFFSASGSLYSTVPIPRTQQLSISKFSSYFSDYLWSVLTILLTLEPFLLNLTMVDSASENTDVK